MKIKRVKFYGFGRYVNQEFIFQDGLNLLEAPNEFGKTTMIYGLLGLLYGGKKEGYRVRRDQEWVSHYLPWKADQYGGEIDYEIMGKVYRIIRSFLPNSDSEQVIDLETGKDLSELFPMDRKRERYILEKQIGISGETYKRIGYFHAGSLLVEKSKKQEEKHNQKLVEKMTQLLKQGAEFDVTPIMEELDKGIDTIGKTENAKNKPLGMLAEKKRQLEERIQYFKRRCSLLDQEERKFEQALQEKDELLKALEHLEQEIEEKQRRLAKHQEFALSYEQYEKILLEEAAYKRNYQKLWIVREELQNLEKELDRWKNIQISNEEMKELEVWKERRKKMEQEKEKILEQLNLLKLEKEAIFDKQRVPKEESQITWNLAKLREYEELELRAKSLGTPKHLEKRAALKKLQNDHLQYQKLEKKEASLQEKKSQLQKDAQLLPVPNKGRLERFLWISTGVLGVFTVCTLFFSLWFMLGGLVLTLGNAWFAKKKQDQSSARIRKINQQRNEIDSNIEFLNRELEKISQRKQQILSMWQVESLSEFYARGEEYQAILLQEEEYYQEWEYLQKQMKRIERDVGDWLCQFEEDLPDFHLSTWRQKIYQLQKQQAIYQEQAYKLDVQIHSLTRELEKLDQEADKMMGYLETLQEKVGIEQRKELEEWIQSIERRKQIEWKRQDVKKKLQQLELAEVEESWQQHLVELVNQRNQLVVRWKGEASPYPKQVLQEEDIQKLKQKRIDIIQALQKLEKEIGKVEGALEEKQEILNRLRQLNTEWEITERKMSELLLEKEAFELAKEVLKESAEEIQEDLSPRLSPIASTWISKITDNRYKKIWIDPTDGMQLSVFAPETGRREAAESLSTGSMDQMYLALRVALVHFYSEETKHKLPLILDDCFVHFDNKRLRKTFTLLEKLAEDHQIIICTCQSRERKIMEELKIPFHSISLQVEQRAVIANTPNPS